jgi:rubredoxin
MNRLFWDIETSPNIGFFWRPGYKVNLSHDNIIKERAIICICYKWEKEKKVHKLVWDKGCDIKLCKEFMAVMEQADEMVAHNGDRFDMKWFRARCLKHDLGVPKDVTTVDTLKLSRSKFELNSHRLDYIAKFLLGYGKIDTSFGLWKGIVLDGCEKSMAHMVRYCKRDVNILQEVYEYIVKYTKMKTHVGVLQGYDGWTCPSCGSSNVTRYGKRIGATGIVRQRMQCQDCGHIYYISQANAKKYAEHILDKKEKENQIKRKTKNNVKKNNKKGDNNSC